MLEKINRVYIKSIVHIGLEWCISTRYRPSMPTWIHRYLLYRSIDNREFNFSIHFTLGHINITMVEKTTGKANKNKYIKINTTTTRYYYTKDVTHWPQYIIHSLSTGSKLPKSI